MNTQTKIFTAIAVLLLVGAALLHWKFGHKGMNPTPTLQTAPMQYENAADGISFSYPGTYKLETHELDITDMKGKYLTLIPANAQIPDAGEGPPGITVAIFENPTHIPLSDWIQKMTNGLPVPTGGWDHSETTIAGETGIAYTATGLYESDNVAIAHGAKVYVLSASWLTRDDQTLKDLQAILTSVHFN